MNGSVVITGASSGLGLAAAEQVARAGHRAVLACRDPGRGAAAAARIVEAVPGASVEVVLLDVASLASVRAAADVLGAIQPSVSSLVCNAGIQVVDGIRRSADGYELTFATNHLGHFLLTVLLQEQLARPARVVVVSSEVHQGPHRSFGFPAPRWQDPHVLAAPDTGDRSARSGRVRYATSKLANLYFTYELARRMPPEQLTANAFDPGLMPETRLDRDYQPFMQKVYALTAPALIRGLPGTRSVAQSGADLAWLATDPSLAGTTGAYFRGRRRAKSSPESRDRERAGELWRVSEELVTANPAARP